MSLRILRLAERIPPLPGGKEIHVAELTRAQSQLGHRVHVLYRFGDEEALDSPATKIHLPGALANLHGLSGTAWFAAQAMRTAGDLSGFDVLHAHGDIAEAWMCSRRTRRSTTPMVLTVHGQLNPRFTRPSRLAFTGVDAFIALGDRVRQDLDRCGVPAERIVTMSSGLNSGLLNEAERDVTARPGLIVAVGTLDRVKNLQTTIRAVMALPDRMNVTLEIIGDGADSSRLKELADGSERVRFLGQQSRTEVYRHVAAADAFVIASERVAGKGEGVPTALLEAMALGQLCIVSSQATPDPVVTDRQSYWTFSPTDVGALTRLISRALTERDERAILGPRARAAVAGLDWLDMARRVTDVYEYASHQKRGLR